MISASTSLILVLAIPAFSAGLLALLPAYRLSARVNIAASALAFLAALSLVFLPRPEAGRVLFVDDLNIVFIVLNTFEIGRAHV